MVVVVVVMVMLMTATTATTDGDDAPRSPLCPIPTPESCLLPKLPIRPDSSQGSVVASIRCHSTSDYDDFPFPLSIGCVWRCSWCGSYFGCGICLWRGSYFGSTISTASTTSILRLCVR